ncbi:MAG TPA: rhodanese-like domain-containing protein [Nitrospirota bacterium]|nr:rhodanese-like domain-containing protein [Nitrospirota bacterium]
MRRRTLKSLLIAVGSMCFLFASAVVYAGHDEIPRIPINDLKKLIDQKADIVILDAQLKDIYDSGHIKGARSLPWKVDLSETDVKNLPKDKLIVVYCDCGPGEADSSDEAAQLLELGFSNVKILGDPSIRGWKKAGYPIEK